jgi:peroxidase
MRITNKRQRSLGLFKGKNIQFFENLELRRLMSASVESIDGTGNNLLHPTWGSTGVDLLRKTVAAYTDGVSSPAGATRPSARAISNAIAASDSSIVNDRNLSAMVYAWGQFLDHDLDLTPSGTTESFNVQVPTGDPSFDPLSTGTQVIPLDRSIYDAATGTSASNPRQQINTITAFIDGSVIYGSDAARAAALRTFGGGQLKTSAGDLLPFNAAGFSNANDAGIYPGDQLFLAGDVRANENIELTSIQTLFMREHNRLAASYAAANHRLSDEQLYQKARQMVLAEIQSITYNEFLPALLGQNALSPYRGYNPNVNPGIANEFSTAAYRFGHSMLDNDIGFLDNNGVNVGDEMPLAQAFFNPAPVEQNGIDPILKYLVSDRAQEIDTKVVDGVRNFLFGPPGAGGLDLASLNIQRGRDNGLADYNTVRAAYGLPKVTSFSQITSDPALAASLQSLYGSVDNIDLWVGGLAENHVAGSSMGATFGRILADQFQRIRDGDRFWYQREFSGRQLEQINNTTLADLIARNTQTTNMQPNVFFFNAKITGSIYNDRNANSRQDRLEQGLGGQTVQLLDSAGNVLANTMTRISGDYQFDGMDIGQYTITIVPTSGWTLSHIGGTSVQITRGGTISNMNLGLTRLGAAPPLVTQPNPFAPPSRPNPFAPPSAMRRPMNDLFA